MHIFLVPQFGEPCGFTEWGDYTRCSRTCDRGRQARERTCCNEEEEDALECTGNLREWRDCQTQECPG